MNRARRVFAGIFTLLALSLASAAASTEGASAAVVHPASASGDPVVTGCWDSSASVVGTAGIYDNYGDYLGFVDNWYSKDCGTNWSEVFVSGGSNEALTVRTFISDGASTDYYTTYNSYAWSDQVFAPIATACAYGKIYINSKYQGSATVCR